MQNMIERLRFRRGALLVVALSTWIRWTHAAEAPRHNVLFLFADDWGRYASAYAAIDGRPSWNDVVRTPHVDRLAREGVLFRRAFVNAPSCTPCRSSLLSGRNFYATGNGAILVGAKWDASIPSFPLLMRDGGYSIGKSFKVWSPGEPADAPFGKQAYAEESAGRKSNNFSEYVTEAVKQGRSKEAAIADLEAEVAENFAAMLKRREPGKPWLYWFGTTTTHRTWVRGSGQALWNIDPESLRDKMPPFLPDVPEVREDAADYLGEVQAVDRYLGVLLKRLEDSGELERTVIIASGDHGAPGYPHGKCNLYDFGTGVPLVVRWPNGRGGRVVDDVVCLPDLMPTLLEIAGVAPPDGVHGESILPWIDPAAAARPRQRNFVVTGRERHVGNAREGNLPYPQRAIRTNDFLYVRNFAPDRWPLGSPEPADSQPTPSEWELETRTGYADMDASPTKAWLVAHRNDPSMTKYVDFAFAKRPAEELFDLNSDPHQVENVAGLPKYADKQAELSQRLMEYLKSTGDPRVTGDGQTFEQPPFVNPDPPRPRKK